MKVMIAAGGTGGHLYPGIAIARELLREPGTEAVFIGTEQGLESRVLPKEGLPLRLLPAGRLKGMSIVARVRTLLALPRSLYAAAGLLRSERPAVLIGIGGYASGPAGLAARMLGIPLIIVEPNAYAGLTNRILGRIAKKIFVCFPGRDSQDLLPARKKVLTGPLVRRGIAGGDAWQALAAFGLEPGRFTVFVMGGSGGAHAINMAMKAAAADLVRIPGLQVLHQTGEKDAAEVERGYRDAGVKGIVLPYIEDMAGAYAAADLVIARSGATTVAELAACGKQAVLVPYPFAADSHQEHNARSLAERGGAEVIVQADLTPGTLAQVIRTYAAGGRRDVPPLPAAAAEEIARACREYAAQKA
jgi:UDP-N-acetylglucosamine--N-acetylmuramyl-(pentapeptide) pyrophosphoryl-undecaprenol N-acetylglucosamine transferase